MSQVEPVFNFWLTESNIPHMWPITVLQQFVGSFECNVVLKENHYSRARQTRGRGSVPSFQTGQ